MSFWTLSTTLQGTGDESSSNMSSFKIIPDNTMAIAKIKEFVLDKNKEGQSHYKVVYKLTAGDFKNREVTQKIKCFDTKTSISDRAINMMQRLYNLTGLKPTHSEAP